MTIVTRRPLRSLLATSAAALACGAGAVALGGCGGAGSVVDPVAQAATTSNQALGYRLTMAMQIASPALPSPITASGQGAFSTPGHTGSFTLDMNLASIPQAAQALGSSTFRLQEVISGTTIYLKLPASLTSKIPSFKKAWLKLDLARAAGAGIPGLSSLTSNPASTDPSQLLRYLRATSGQVTKVGTASVDGFSTTHYRGQINLDRVPDTLPPASRPAARQALSALERIAHIHLLPVNVWIDDHHLVRRLQMNFNQSVAGAGSLTVAIRVDIPQYGSQPAPTLPPPSQVQDITGLASGSSSP
jgi:hypothetical protein